MITTSPQHVSVLLEESINALVTDTAGTYIDATFGRGGHTRALLEKLGNDAQVIALDQDPQAIEAAKTLQDDPRFDIIHTPFSNLQQVLEQRQLTGKVTGILFDLGVSSPQLDDAERGFSFMRDGPLDMRMDTTRGETAAEWLNRAEKDEISWVLKEYGEERFARKIASAIVMDREKEPFVRTKQLADMIARVSPVKEKHKHPATRTFQAIRIHVNKELEQIEQALEASLSALKQDGRLVVISFHSLEDRLVKRFIRKHSEGKQVPAGLPVTDAEINKDKSLEKVGKAIKPGKHEVSLNPRARSSVLRIARRVYHD
ncbi:ribosomal RNA small subunit methyltransferase H [Idiomarina sp. WRN-38]|jgi:16S rRNA (cytosine1402-N4)-methyltransferase|uniref:Ribosomal RNA small subunit methyltransferase H n=1 Tax=Idiomarina piscisalsi TaxID=1096243 RepID=A0A432YU80_9GAMM|nr:MULTISPECIES: 16S rRNA (cytosine(1402)-N(4))-methyltransferase RsmH [Idiomarina]KTG28538.1 ribosomal RNA small subunit methyltransferase H [Idiomarina sp. H105]OAF08066.1 ribosomal RNA small subunit methyltransferase H [Idiomarina sp. WRN-38]MCH2454154.1 16S rRNA (cytosine(1402)-N(4))-methyltransferase RsmH [Idiomarina sp.]RUO66876.1 16S rRNA (cytosine(1402)-N(4))-methyltransferase RsmH [Idiomarina piscisalsi]WPZ01746.1 16S rRNA (cytosine(1402)-N(4))-methyltransferase RsmH [Idiomarina sp. O|tara:strand:- start:208 stop:1155 length:948 start_codon:yes stop_codon:yes gene_type:complete